MNYTALVKPPISYCLLSLLNQGREKGTVLSIGGSDYIKFNVMRLSFMPELTSFLLPSWKKDYSFCKLSHGAAKELASN